MAGTRPQGTVPTLPSLHPPAGIAFRQPAGRARDGPDGGGVVVWLILPPVCLGKRLLADGASLVVNAVTAAAAVTQNLVIFFQ